MNRAIRLLNFKSENLSLLRKASLSTHVPRILITGRKRKNKFKKFKILKFLFLKVALVNWDQV